MHQLILQWELWHANLPQKCESCHNCTESEPEPITGLDAAMLPCCLPACCLLPADRRCRCLLPAACLPAAAAFAAALQGCEFDASTFQ